jgi:Golgi nucleoside diphosphatase
MRTTLNKLPSNNICFAQPRSAEKILHLGRDTLHIKHDREGTAATIFYRMIVCPSGAIKTEKKNLGKERTKLCWV